MKAFTQAEIEALVRQVVARTLGGPEVKRAILDAEAVQQMAVGSSHTVAEGTIVTPLARQVALERHIRLQEAATPAPQVAGSGMQRVALGADHGGYAMKEAIKKLLQDGYTVIDCGTHSSEAVDYPDYAYAVAQTVASGKADCGIIVDGAGIGSCMVANKVPGVRAAMCYDQATAVNSREHNNTNVLTLGAGLIGQNLANQIVTTWLNTDFAGGRHARRVDKIDAIGRRFSK